ncbi:MAG: thymidine kinase, partial [Spirochaetales bacterium]|nr:thymidine kinase [Spirochaetales bacterium]
MAPTESNFLKSLGLPSLTVYPTATHFDFTQEGRRVLIIGPMGSGKSEWAARIWRDGEVARKKGEAVAELTTSKGVDRRNLFYIRSQIDRSRFKDFPDDALPFRGGYIRCGENIAFI